MSLVSLYEVKSCRSVDVDQKLHFLRDLRTVKTTVAP